MRRGRSQLQHEGHGVGPTLLGGNAHDLDVKTQCSGAQDEAGLLSARGRGHDDPVHLKAQARRLSGEFLPRHHIAQDAEIIGAAVGNDVGPEVRHAHLL